MINLTSNTSKPEFLEQLSLEASKTGALYIQIIELPSYLDTQISLTIFSYQLSNYPREIIWSSTDSTILQLLRDSQLHVADNCLKPHFPSETVSEISPVTAEINSEVRPNNIAIDTSHLSKSGFFKKNSLEVSPNLDLENYSNDNLQNHTFSTNQGPELSVGQTTKDNTNKLPTEQEYIAKAPESYSNGMQQELDVKPSVETNLNNLSLAKFFTKEKYHPISILSKEEPEIKTKALETKDANNIIVVQNLNYDEDLDVIENNLELDDSNSANLDSWLERIQATRDALQGLRMEEVSPNQNFFNQTIAKPKSKWFYTMTASSIVSVLIVAFLVFFPTQAYTLEIYADYQDGTFSLDTNKTELSKKSVLLESKISIPTQNKEKTETERATGTVNLINEGGKEVLLDNAKFQLVKDGFRYTPIFNSTLLNTFGIPAQNNKSGDPLQFTIQSVPQSGVAGSSFNQPVGTRLKIVNLQDQSPCSSCYAVVVAEVSNKNGVGNKIVSDADYDSLKNLAAQDIQKQLIDKMQEVRVEKVFTGKDWFKDLDTNISFSSKIGEKADNVDLKETVNSEIYYILRSAVEEKIRQKNPEVDKIKDLALLGTEGDINLGDSFKANFYYTYSKVVKVDTSTVSNLLAAKEFDQAKDDISKEYPSIKRIEKQDLGIKLPGLTPRKEIKIVEKN